jgi:hypothetical protein
MQLLQTKVSRMAQNEQITFIMAIIGRRSTFCVMRGTLKIHRKALSERPGIWQKNPGRKTLSL